MEQTVARVAMVMAHAQHEQDRALRSLELQAYDLYCFGGRPVALPHMRTEAKQEGPSVKPQGFWTLQEAGAFLGISANDVRREAGVRGMRLLSLGGYPNGGYRIKATDVARLHAELGAQRAS